MFVRTDSKKNVDSESSDDVKFCFVLWQKNTWLCVKEQHPTICWVSVACFSLIRPLNEGLINVVWQECLFVGFCLFLYLSAIITALHCFRELIGHWLEVEVGALLKGTSMWKRGDTTDIYVPSPCMKLWSAGTNGDAALFLFNIYQARCCCCCLHVCRKYETLEEIFFFLRHPHWPRCDVHGGVEPVWQPNVKYFTLHIFFIHLKANISTRISIVILSVKLVIIFMFQSASQGPPPPFLLLLRLSSSSSIPPPHISPVLLLLPPCPPCGAARPWWTLPARWTRSPRCRRSNRWTSTTSTGLRSAPASGGCCRNRTALQVLQLTALGRCLGGALNN